MRVDEKNDHDRAFPHRSKKPEILMNYGRNDNSPETGWVLSDSFLI